jgi:acyl carrier protein
LGYLNQPELTQQRFVTDPFSEEPGARLYKTGDLGRWLAEGSIEFLGRNDQQVKWRGFRIEPGEIEAQLARHAEVQETTVILREDVPGEKRLVAYLTLRGDRRPSVGELRAHLASTLPEYMIPSAFVILASLPLTPNGKLNRAALPQPELEAHASEDYEAPEGEIEIALAQLWQEVLGLVRVGRSDHFFALGGHSLLAMQLIVRVRAALSIEMTMSALFDSPRLKDLAAHLEKLQDALMLERMSTGDHNMERLLETVASMPEQEVLERVRALSVGGPS